MYKTRIASDFFNIKGLETRTGLNKCYWKIAILKELTDNALDAIEPEAIKEVEIISNDDGFAVYDNGIGFSVDDVKQFYDFNNYVSKNRHIITASRGKQGNGLKSVIGMCYVEGYTLLWHTNDGVILRAVFDASQIEDQELEVDFEELGLTEKKGIQIFKLKYVDEKQLTYVIEQYSICNPDVNFRLEFKNNVLQYNSTSEPINRIQETSLGFYTFNEYKRLISVQDSNKTYKAFLNEYFGTRISNSSGIKSKIKDLNMSSPEVKHDFELLKVTLKNKPNTLLRKHLLGYSHIMETYIKTDFKIENEETVVPCIVEYNLTKLDNKQEKTLIECYINNSITYLDGRSISFELANYKISNSRNTHYSYDLQGLLEKYTDYVFEFHFISPYLKLKDHGKTKIDISDFIDELVSELRKSFNKETKKYNTSINKKPSQKSLAEKYMTNAFLIASTNGKYSITARQMYYKLRELARKENFDWETDNTYSQFTQNWLTSWLEQNEDYEDKVNFSDRGNYYIYGSQKGLGSANVRNFINTSDDSINKFLIYGGISDNIRFDPQFDFKYKYDKVLYIEKTGFDAVFKSEKLDERYNLIIVSGQGFASRAARNLLYHFQQQGLKLFCMHDLDISGVDIYNSMCKANDKFKFDLNIVNLGITPEDVNNYGVEPEAVEKADVEKLYSMDYEHRTFFNKGEMSRRVEINAFSTEQLLDIIDTKLKYENNLPTVSLSDTLQLDNVALREVAFMQLIRERYQSQLDKIDLPCDLSSYNGKYTVKEANDIIPMIQKKLVQQYKQEILRKIAI